MTTCLTPAELLVNLFPGEKTLDASHARSCPACSARLAVLGSRLGGVAPAERHPTEIEFAELLDARSDDELDVRVVAHLQSCGECVRELEALVELVGDPAVRAELERPQWRAREEAAAIPRRRHASVAFAALAAAAALVLAVRSLAPRSDANSSALRHATIDVAAAPRLVAPDGLVDRLDTLTWTSVARADRYRVTVFDANGETAWETEIPDTVVSMPSSVASRLSGSFRWRVKARTSFDRWVDSKFGSFSIGGDRQ